MIPLDPDWVVISLHPRLTSHDWKLPISCATSAAVRFPKRCSRSSSRNRPSWWSEPWLVLCSWVPSWGPLCCGAGGLWYFSFLCARQWCLRLWHMAFPISFVLCLIGKGSRVLTVGFLRRSLLQHLHLGCRSFEASHPCFHRSYLTNYLGFLWKRRCL